MGLTFDKFCGISGGVSSTLKLYLENNCLLVGEGREVIDVKTEFVWQVAQ